MRRSLVLAVGAVLASAAVVIACGGDDDPPPAVTLPPGPVTDAAPPPPPQRDAGPTARVHSAGNCGPLEAASQFGAVGSEGINAFALSGDGTGLVVGASKGEVDFGGGKLSATKNSFFFFARHDASFAHVASARFGDDSTSTMSFLGRAPGAAGYGVALASNGGALIVGGLAGGMDLGGGMLSSVDSWRNMADAGLDGGSFDTSCSECQRDMFLLELDAQGKHVASKRFGDAGDDYATSVAYLPNNDGFVIAGAFAKSADFGNGVTVSKTVNNGLPDAFVARFDATGTAQWARVFGGPSGNQAMNVAVDASSNIYVTGTFRGTSKLGATELTAPASSEDAFVVKLDAQGTQAWAVQIGATYSATGRSIAVDGAGNVIITGTFRGVVKHGTSSFQSPFTNAYVAMFDPQGKAMWAKGWGGMYGGYASHVIFTPEGGIVAAGGVDAYGALRVDFGGGLVDPVGEHDVYVVELDGQGQHICSRRFGGGGGEQRPFVALDAAGRITLATSFQTATTIGPKELEPAGATDIMFVRMRRKR